MAAVQTDHLARLYRISQTLNSSLDLDQVLNRVMDEVIAATRAERGFLMLRDTHGRLVFRAARGINQQTLEAPEFQVSRSVVERVANEGLPRLTSDAQSDAWLGERTSVRMLGLRSILCVPLQLKEATLGVVYVDNRLQAGIFTPGDLELLNAIASSAAIAIENARLYQVAVEKGRLERELQLARELQASLLPHGAPEIPGWDVAARWQPAREVAGDFYDFIPAGQGRTGVVIGDVSDKGMAAALFMALTRSIVRASISSASSPADGITQANRLICADSANGMFVTLFYAQLDPTSGEMVYVNAGHNPPLFGHGDQDNVVRLSRTGMALGILEMHQLGQSTVQFGSGDFVLFYTDGLTEALNAQGQEFGEARLQRTLLEHRRAPAVEIVGALEQALSRFTGGIPPFDDITLVVLKRL